MFTQLSLRNFKAWRDAECLDASGQPQIGRINIPLAPVTMLLGTNSSGKSSLLQVLLLLKQTVASPDRSVHLNLGGNEANDYFNFGHFDDVLTHNASPRQFELGFKFRHPDSNLTSTKRRLPTGEFSATYGRTSAGSAVVQELALRSDTPVYRAIRRDKGAYSIMVGDQARGKSRMYAPERSIALPVEAIQLLAADGPMVEDISLALRRELEAIAYLGPLRRKPERDYTWNKSRPGELGIDGAEVINALLASALSRSKDKDDDTAQIIQKVSAWLARMGVAEKIEVKQLGHSTRYEVVVYKDGIAANLRDVGIGVSQVLPVITLAFFAPLGSTVILEEPEIHLHPLAQAVLAELFVEVSRERKIQFIVETHSEHLFRRLQTLVARDSSTRDECLLYFVERAGADAKLKQLELDPYGRLTEWPPMFFGDALGETREQARLMFERQRVGSPK